jgi:hypothetical protein
MGESMRLILLVIVAVVGIVAGAAVSSGIHFGGPTVLVHTIDSIVLGGDDQTPSVNDHAHETLCGPIHNVCMKETDLLLLWIVTILVAWEPMVADSFERPPRAEV